MLKQRALWSFAAVGLGAGLGWAGARAAGQGPPGAAVPSWLRGDHEERFGQVENHLRGLDVAMMEIGYRYTELFFAVADGNWDYADYQVGKIELALKLAVERRPKRAASANAFLTDDWPAVQAGVRSRRPPRAQTAMERLRTACMKCHVSEAVPYFTLQAPERRLTSIRPARE